jgi:phosphoserine aminotransferase
MMMKPTQKPVNPCFSSGPCAKRPGWSVEVLASALVGRSHRSGAGKKALQQVIEETRSLLGVPADYKIGIVPASDTGAIEMAMWTMLGARGVDVFAWESFSDQWVTDIVKQLKLSDVRTFKAAYGQLPDLSQADKARDIVFCWNGTTSGVRVPNGDWIAGDREGLTFCDATSAVFAMEMPWDKLDVTTFSWQKVLGGEAQHGILILSPRAVARLESYVPAWPLPKIFRLTKGGKLLDEVFEGSTINTPSMLCVADILDALAWSRDKGGLSALVQRSEANLAAVEAWAAKTPWIGFLAAAKNIRSCTSICLVITDTWFTQQSAEQQAAITKKMVKMLEQENAGLDLGSYRDAPAGLRLWGGATVETADLQALFPWIEWAYQQCKQEQAKAA